MEVARLSFTRCRNSHIWVPRGFGWRQSSSYSPLFSETGASLSLFKLRSSWGRMRAKSLLISWIGLLKSALSSRNVPIVVPIVCYLGS
ncbi:hypothetical protein BDV19DRAFT_352708 [Aspergillus venezuelensis]